MELQIRSYINRELNELEAWLLEDKLCIPAEFSFYPHIHIIMNEIIVNL